MSRALCFTGATCPGGALLIEMKVSGAPEWSGRKVSFILLRHCSLAFKVFFSHKLYIFRDLLTSHGSWNGILQSCCWSIHYLTTGQLQQNSISLLKKYFVLNKHSYVNCSLSHHDEQSHSHRWQLNKHILLWGSLPRLHKTVNLMEVAEAT